MKTYQVIAKTTITHTYTIEAESEEEVIERAQDNSCDYDDEEIDEEWFVEE
jgi:hypothetical protein